MSVLLILDDETLEFDNLDAAARYVTDEGLQRYVLAEQGSLPGFWTPVVVRPIPEEVIEDEWDGTWRGEDMPLWDAS